jgi:putative hemolysin
LVFVKLATSADLLGCLGADMELYVLFILILLNGFFAMSEIALVSARRARLQPLADRGDVAARMAVALGADPTRFLSTVQIGITSVAMLSGIVGEATLAPPLAERFAAWGVSAQAAGYLATGAVVALVTYLSIVVGELVPKRIGQIHAETVARFVSAPIRALSIASKPFVWLLMGSTQVLLRVLGVDDKRREPVTEEEIHAVLHEGSSSGAIEEEERRMVQNVFLLDDRSIGSLMTPRPEIACLEVDATPEEVVATMEEHPHSRYPVVKRDRQDVVGVVSARVLLLALMRGEPLDLEALSGVPLFLPESISGRDVLDRFREARTNMAFVVDEYGELQGLVTLHDVLEAIAGQFDGPAEESVALQREDGSWLLDGQLPMADLAQFVKLDWPDPKVDEDFETIGGLVLWRLGRLARTGDVVHWRGWKFEVIDMDAQRIDKILASRQSGGG